MSLKFNYKNLAPKPFSSLWLWLRFQNRKKNERNFCILDHTPVSNDDDTIIDEEKNFGLNNLNSKKLKVNNFLDISSFFKMVDIDNSKSLIVIKKNEFISHFLLTLGEVKVVLIAGSISILGFQPSLNQELKVSTGFASYTVTFDLLNYHHYSDIDGLTNSLKEHDINASIIFNFLVNDSVISDCIIISFQKYSCPSLLLLKMLLNPFIPNDDWFKINFNEPRLSFVHTLKEIAHNVYQATTENMQNFFDLSLASKPNKFIKLLFCGGKNAGKSSSLRYFANLLLTLGLKSLYIFDCDPGQTEFSPPGQISIIHVTQPLLYPPFINVLYLHSNIVLSSSVAGTSASNNPDLYLINFCYLWNSFVQFQEYNPCQVILINTMGWTQDIGYYLLLDMIRLVKPTHVVEIKFNLTECKDNFPFDCCPQNINTANGWSIDMKADESLEQEFQEVNLESIDYEYIKLSTIWKSSRSKISKMNRINSQIAYICRIQELIFKPISDLDCYKLNWSKVYFHIEYEFPIDSHFILDALELSWIQLCHIDHLSPPQSEQINVLPNLSENYCLGNAIVHYIDRNEKIIYLITPEAPEKIEKTNCLVRPYGMNVPKKLMSDLVMRKFQP